MSTVPHTELVSFTTPDSDPLLSGEGIRDATSRQMAGEFDGSDEKHSPGKESVSWDDLMKEVIEGRVEEVIKIIRKNPLYGAQAVSQRFLPACLQADPGVLIDTIFRHILAFTGALLLRAQMDAEGYLRYVDQNGLYSSGAMPPPLQERLDRVIRLSNQYVFIATSYADVMRKLDLTRRSEQAADSDDENIMPFEEMIHESA